MPYYNNSSDHPWDDGVYGTGRTQPPKSHGGLICVLLILVIFLSGVVTFLGIMNIRLSYRLNEKEEELSLAFDEQAEAAVYSPEEPAMAAEIPAAEPEISLDLLIPPETEETLPPDDSAPMTPLAIQDIYERCIPTVVSITGTSRGGSSTGTGVVVSASGYLVTNNHVIENTASITVQLTDDRTFAAVVVGSDPVTDLAVLHIDAENLTPAEFGSSEALRVGDSVVAIGDPLGVQYRGTMTNGIISAINRDVTIKGRSMNLIQTNAALNSGNSGGPLINCYGQVIGINTMKIGFFADDAGVEGLGFAIPSATVKDIVDQIIAQGYVSGRPSLGIQGEGISLFYQRYYRLPSGMYVTEVESGSAAEAAGIQPGDILLALDNTRIFSMNELTTMLYQYSAGDTIKLDIYRSGTQYEISVKLKEAKG